MILEKAGNLRRAGRAATQHAITMHHLAEEELAVAQSQGAEVGVVERAGRFGKAAQHQSIPPCQDLLVPRRPHAFLSRVVQDASGPFHRRAQFVRRDSLLPRHRVWITRHVEDVPALEVAAGRHSPVDPEQGSILTQQGVELSGIPHVVATFVPFGIGVEGGVESPIRRGHLARQPTEGVVRHATCFGIARGLPEMRAEPHEQCIVVQHLLEVRHQPLRIHGVAREPAADLIVDAAARHALESVRRHLERERLTRACPLA